MKLRWTARAEQDLVNIAVHISRDSAISARNWVRRLIDPAARSTILPLSGRAVPEIGDRNVREFIVGNYRIVYRIEGDEIRVLTVFESHRRL